MDSRWSPPPKLTATGRSGQIRAVLSPEHQAEAVGILWAERDWSQTQLREWLSRQSQLAGERENRVEELKRELIAQDAKHELRIAELERQHAEAKAKFNGAFLMLTIVSGAIATIAGLLMSLLKH